jgi:hypothetical protein
MENGRRDAAIRLDSQGCRVKNICIHEEIGA